MLMGIVQSIYVMAVLWLSCYGLYTLWLTWAHWRSRKRRPVAPPLSFYPIVTVQLPIYNELCVVERLLAAVTALNYPRDRLQIQVLDDSTDETSALAERLVGEYRAQGFDIERLHRGDRRGFKAGNLAHGLPGAKGEYVAVFDADFVPSADWILNTLPHLVLHPKVGYVLTRWGHLNEGLSPLTMAQAVILNAHFAIELQARWAQGYFVNAYGSAGIWRRSCIESSGGWPEDMLSEDLDLSFRAQIAGWRVLYLRDVVANAELPATMGAFRAQQFRWTKGTAQCLRKLGTQVLRAQHPWPVRLEALTHLSVCLTLPALVALVLTLLPLIWMGQIPRIGALSYLGVTAIGVPCAMVLAQYELRRCQQGPRAWWVRALYVPVALLLGAGLVANCARAVLEGLLNHRIIFERTPKGAVNGLERGGNGYRQVLSRGLGIELLFTLYSAAVFVVAFKQDQFWALPFLFLCVCGSVLVTALIIREDLFARAVTSP